MISNLFLSAVLLTLLTLCPIFGGDSEAEENKAANEALVKSASELSFKLVWSDDDAQKLVKLLQHEELAVFFQANITIASHEKYGIPEVVLKTLLQKYPESTGRRRQFVVISMNRVSGLHDGALALFREGLNSPEHEKRAQTCEDLSLAPNLFKKIFLDVDALLKREVEISNTMTYLILLKKAFKASPAAISDEIIVDYIEKAFRDQGKDARVLAVVSAGFFESIYPSKKEQLRKIIMNGLKDGNPWVSATSALALSNLGISADNTEDILKKALTSEDEVLIRSVLRDGSKIMKGDNVFLDFARSVSKSASPEQSNMIDRLMEKSNGK